MSLPFVRSIAFYLPQFHPIPENDTWWGTGFTEWRNVVNARPRFPGHYQPHLPTELGFYDLRLPEVRRLQADLAARYGIYGFCYYHFWFNGRRLLERPFTEVLTSGDPDFPFCLCWANENWTRAWDGDSQEVLLAQSYGEQDDRAHIEDLLPALRDRRYIRVDGRPLLLVYRTELLPNPRRTAEIWRQAAAEAGLGDLCLARVESFSRVDPKTIGFDAAVEFAPDWSYLGPRISESRRYRVLRKAGLIPRGYIDNHVFSYDSVVERMLGKPRADYTWFRTVTPSWDNSARRSREAVILHGSTPKQYEGWLRSVVLETAASPSSSERIVFINAWNEWAEGSHLEPDQRWGRGYLEATRRALTEIPTAIAGVMPPTLGREVQ